ncbi:glycosyl transferase [Thermaurantimonas aggregans]|uniref:Glycosyl transferase n=1 Tax=Thermaurantimonas aggregans TaxID=2173829 RepID=A0A401XNM2_9FLAO|nr:glycosyltransferase family protein [Thermaurantimonas aggregans]MCX8148020.1 glycosyl transferase [Thermaurantimonas aggregans]GCD78616.1 glycosyl transferase [Thermaurantimonas aggregans]
MKRVLYAIQGTGNGHVSRALVVVPILKRHFDVDILISGRQSNLHLPFEVHYKYTGVSFVYDKSGGLSYSKTLFHNNLAKAYKELKSLPVNQYDLVISDFEPISAYSAYLKNVPSLAFSHQASFLSNKVPRPKKKNKIGELVLHRYAPCRHNLGIHFQRYEPWIIPPVLRPEILNATPTESDEYLVYLPAYGDSQLVNTLKKIDEKFTVFSKFASFSYKNNNVNIIPADAIEFTKRLISCKGVITGAGFETPAEALYLGKKLLCIPIKGQYEQYCNAAALSDLGVIIADRLSVSILKYWISTSSQNSYVLKSELKQLPSRIPELINQFIS